MMANKRWRFFLFVLFIVACWLLGRIFAFDVEAMRQWFSNFPLVFSGFVYVILYVLTTTFIWLGPKDVFRVSGALLFGALVSTIFITIAELANACFLFTLSRRLGHDYIAEKFSVKKDEVKKIQKQNRFWGLCALRINPLIPFRLMDLGAGLSSTTLRKYLMICLLASPLRIFWLQYILAKVGTRLIEAPNQMVNLLADDTLIMRLSIFYFLLVIVLSLLAGLEKWVFKGRNTTQLN